MLCSAVAEAELIDSSGPIVARARAELRLRERRKNARRRERDRAPGGRSTSPFGSARKIRPLLTATKKRRASTPGVQNDREKPMAKAPPSAKRDRIKAFTPALVEG